MAILTRRGSVIESVFGIHGDDENDLSGGFAYLLTNSSGLLRQVVNELLPGMSFDLSKTKVKLQTSRKGEGITDIELELSDQGFIVFEAKIGMVFPTIAQLQKYAPRCKKSRCKRTKLVALTAIRQEPAEVILGVKEIDDVPVTARSWEWLRVILAKAIPEEHRTHVRWLLSEYKNYLEGFMGHDRVFSNLVYVVALGQGKPEGWDISWIDLIEKHNRYFYPAGRNWPSPPNYLGFRYNGRLQAINHVKSFQVVTDLPAHFLQRKRASYWGSPFYLLELGPRIEPARQIRSGPRVIRNARVWCMLDALLTSDTVSDALTETERRRKEEIA